MFIGHFAVGFASKRFAPRTSLGLLMAAPLLLDLLWPMMLLAGVEHMRVDPSRSPFLRMILYDYPWSHSLLMSLVWCALFSGGYWLATRDRMAAAVLAAGLGLYLAATRARDWIGSVALWAFAGLLLASYVSSIFATPPDDPVVLGVGGLVSMLFPLWSHWFDRHRTARRGPPPIAMR